MKKAVVYFEPDNLLSTGINGTVDVIRQFYNIGNTMMLGYDEEHEDGYPYNIKGLKIFDEEWNLIHQEGDCTSKYDTKEDGNVMAKEMTFHDYVLIECERQWNECQAEQHGEWASQSDDTKAEYYKDMHSHLLPTKGELDGIID